MASVIVLRRSLAFFVVRFCRAAVDRYDNRRNDFDKIYSFRSKVEGVISVIKRMFHG